MASLSLFKLEEKRWIKKGGISQSDHNLGVSSAKPRASIGSNDLVPSYTKVTRLNLKKVKKSLPTET